MAWLDTAARTDALRTWVRDRQNQFRALPQRQRWGTWIALEALLVIVLGALDLSLGVGAFVLMTILWVPKLDDLRIRLGIEVALVVFLLVVEPSAGVLVAIGLGLTWVPPRWRTIALPTTVIVLAIGYPFYFDKLFTIPLFGEFPDVRTGVVMLVYVMMAIGLNIVVGYAGLLDLGYVAFYAIGAYTVAWFASLQFSGEKANGEPARIFHFGAVGIDPKLGGFHISIWILLALAGVLASFSGVVIGLPTLRLRGDYLAIVTLGFGEILPQIARNGDNLFGTGFNLTNGPNGITPIDAPGFGDTISNATGGVLPANYLTCCNADVFNHQVMSADVFFWTALALVLFTVFCSWRLRDSRLGRAWIAIREDETAAAAMGVPLMRTKTWAYASGAFFGGIAGAYYASFKSATFPGDFFFNISIFILCMVILGGMGNIWGVIVGALFLAYLDQAGLANTGSWLNDNLGVAIDVPLYEFGIFGVILLTVMLFRPEGLIPSSRRAAEFHEGVSDEPLYDLTH
jgi:branched-chain amino acid transport system permease protein